MVEKYYSGTIEGVSTVDRTLLITVCFVTGLNRAKPKKRGKKKGVW